MKSDMAVAVVMNLFTVEVLLTLYICFFYKFGISQIVLAQLIAFRLCLIWRSCAILVSYF